MKHLTYILTSIVVLLSSCSSKATTEQINDTAETMKTKIDAIADSGYKYDSFTTESGRHVNIAFIKHGSLIVDIDNYLVYIDPVTIFGNDFSALPKADMILVTHEHHDHFDKSAIEQLSGDSTLLIESAHVAELFGLGDAIEPGDSLTIEIPEFSISAVPAYNISSDHLQFHPKDRKNIGFIFTIDGLRIYVAGDTEDIPEMGTLNDIDIAFLPVNQPYTMTPAQAINAVDMIKSARSASRQGKLIVYPYHYGETDLTPLVSHFKNSDIDIRIRQLQ